MARRLAASSAPVKVFFYIIKHHCHGCARAFSPHHSRGTNLYVFPNKYVKISCVISKITVFQTFAPSRLRLTSGYPLRQALAGLPRARPNSAALKKRKRFLGRPNFAHAPALCEMARADGGSSFQTPLFAAARAGPAQPRNKIHSKLTRTQN